MNAETPTPTDPSTARTRRRLWPWFVAIVIAGALFALILFFTWTRLAQNAVEREIARISKAGEPTTYAEIASAYKLPANEIDATKEWQAVVDYFRSDAFQESAKSIPLFDSDADKIPKQGEPWPHQDVIEKFVLDHQLGLQLIETASEKRGMASFPIKFELGPRAELPHVQFLREAGRLLELQFQLAVRQSDDAKMEKAITAVFAIILALEREPLIVGQLTRLSLLNVQTRLIPLHLAAARPADEILDSWRKELARLDSEKLITTTLLAERVTGIQSFADPLAYPDSDFPPIAYGSCWPRHPMQLFSLLHTYRTLQKFVDQGFPQMLDEVPSLDQWVDDEDLTNYEYWKRAYTRRAMPPFGAFSTNVASSQTKVRACDAMIAAYKFRRRTGAWPESLEKMVPDLITEVPKDAFRGEPLAYYLGADFLIIYGFGRDKKDQMGLNDRQENDDSVIYLDPKPIAGVAP